MEISRGPAKHFPSASAWHMAEDKSSSACPRALGYRYCHEVTFPPGIADQNEEDVKLVSTGSSPLDGCMKQ
jgi:hypothetical protein